MLVCTFIYLKNSFLSSLSNNTLNLTMKNALVKALKFLQENRHVSGIFLGQKFKYRFMAYNSALPKVCIYRCSRTPTSM